MSPLLVHNDHLTLQSSSPDYPMCWTWILPPVCMGLVTLVNIADLMHVLFIHLLGLVLWCNDLVGRGYNSEVRNLSSLRGHT